MYKATRVFARSAGVALLLAAAAWATLVPRLSFEELVDKSEIIAGGKIARSWTAWDASHKYIWTHYELAVTSLHKGRAARTVEFAEPGGELDGRVMVIAGSVQYERGAEVMIFLSRMPNGLLRTSGWAQGRYDVDGAGTLHAASSAAELTGAINSGSSPRTLEGLSVSEFGQRVAARIRTTGGLQ
jgi:hypothetical protein